MNNRKVVTSAIIVSPPKETWGPIQDIRLKFDKAYKRWMPHINLIYPFYPAAQFASVLPALQEGLAGLAPFTVRFDKFDYFEHGASSCTLFLSPTVQPPNALRDLQAALERVFPDCTDQSSKSTDGFHAHLTVGQFRGKAMTERKKAELMQSWKPIEWRVDHVQLISRNSTDPFEVLHTVPLGSGSASRRQQSQQQLPQQAQLQLPRPQLAPNAATGAAKRGPAQPGEAESIVLSRLAQWIAQNGASARAGNLPKTRAKLRAAIRPMCAVKVQYVDVNEALRQLREEDLVQVVGAESPTAKVTFPKKRAQLSGDELQSTNAYIARDSYRLANEARKDPTKLVMARCREWVESPLNTPTTLEALRNSLRQLCIMKEEVEADQAVKLLEARNIISVDYDDKVTYASA